MSGTVIIGTGQAGVECAFALRSRGYDGAITLVGDDPDLPYQRPPLSKEVLKSRGASGWMPLRGAPLYPAQRVDLRLGVRADRILRSERRVILSDGGDLGFEHLILATGARNRIPAIAGLATLGAQGLRNAADARALVTALEGATQVAILGAGFIGLETAAALFDSRCTVTVFESGSRVMGRAVSPEVSDWFLRFHRHRGTRITLGATIAAAEPGMLTLGNGDRCGFDVLLIAAGVQPDVGLAAQAGLSVSNGIETDALHRTSDPRIFSIGDCALAPHPFHAGPVRLESVANAAEQGRRVAAVLAGQAVPGQTVPWFWSTQGSARLQIAGLGAPGDDTHLAGDLSDISDDASLVARRYRNGQCVAVETVNAAPIHMEARRTLLPATSGPRSRTPTPDA
ncbi:pyridine nucleotide-disulfide oxidoreductase [Pseudooceanicola sediminis]|uniref:Pyridine nucleotide-disulfide oxidoreductase n=1 Tax=Pseudooceanicola sediminis TaxID=2211117 RepID=A0A399J1E8_9RHOB|nr:FAD-dependent oxidoreductase [Pseudooceanicola sediminis]KAA2316339.1 NAD(P)-binding protein [Puniceibacterium sp. HSS470]RII39253.1 pyridine nucleotide-disulfide oxidoreductase [Pseudooceanicola sediminis]|tara:strand:+ start:16685 stop:17878 length:1194 start_codon:yes stop_codon:yes gene_type:complete